MSEPQSKKALAEDIEEARGELAETVDALVAKTDVKRRVGEKADEVKATVSAKAQDAKDKVGHAKDTVVAKAQEAKEKAAEKAADVKVAAAAKAEQLSGHTEDRAADLADKGERTVAGTKDLLADGTQGAKAKVERATTAAKRNPVPVGVGAAVLAAIVFLVLRKRNG